jgi:sulfatase maturation enzyme AslB (radical SAM superfamily)
MRTFAFRNKPMKQLWELPFQIIEACPYPVFRQDLPEISLFYAPGYLAAAHRHFAGELEHQLCNTSPSWSAALSLRDYALSAVKRWDEQNHEKPFVPLCLTLYTSQRCNLACSYCFSQDQNSQQESDLDLDFILEAAEKVIRNCKNAGVPFTLVVHGGGEPTLDSRLPQILTAVTQAVSRHEIGCFRYLATNGVMSEETASWAVQTFDEIGLSCDGPPDIQTAQRPLKNGQSSMDKVKQMAAILRACNKPLHIRATITSQTLERMPEIAAYLFGTLHADEVRVEPVFQGGRTHTENNISPELAEKFCLSFLEARRIAASYGKRWLSTGSRPGEIHGRYCQVTRDVLHLLPGNGVSACFKIGSRRQAQALGMDIRDGSTPVFSVDKNRVRTLQSKLTHEDPACETCINHYHCARGCPDICPAFSNPGTDGLRCKINRMLTTALLQELARQITPQLQNNPATGIAIRGGL